MLLEISRYVNQSTKFRPEKCDGWILSNI
jgi:hypothetical protein